MSTRTSNPVSDSVPWLGAGLAVSVLLHLSLGVLLITTATPSLELRVPRQNVSDDTTPPPRPRLGVEESKLASISWLGFADPTEHAAPTLFPLDQAALTRSPDVPSEIPPDPRVIDPVPPTSPPVSQTTQEQTSTQPTAPAVVTPASSEALPAASEDSPIVIPKAGEGEQAVEQPIEGPAEVKPAESAESPSEPQEKPSDEAAATPTTEPVPVGPPVPAAVPPSKPGIPDERDATPTAQQITLTMDKLGKPAAGEGLEIQTVRLDSQDKAIRMLAGALKNPTVRIQFKRQDKGPAIASLVEYLIEKQPDETEITRDTGNPDIDRILRLNIYRWTATGKAIDEVNVGETVEIHLKLHLH